MDSLLNFKQAFKEEIIPILYKTFQKTERERMLTDSFNEAILA
jgi:hypothetical protein